MFGNLVEVVVYARDMQKMVQFYRDTLGLEVTYPKKEDYSKEHWVTFATGECVLSLHSGGEQNKLENEPVFTFATQDIQSAKKILEDAGLATSTVIEATPGTFVFHSWDPEQNHFSVKMIQN